MIRTSYASVTAPCHSGDVRLAGSSDPLRGRVEVCVNETWGTICEEFWDTNDTSVLCRQLGFSAEGKCKLYIFNDSTAFLGLMLQSCNCCELFKGFAILVANPSCFTGCISQVSWVQFLVTASFPHLNSL